MRSIIDFIKYNNAFPVILAVVLLGTGAAFAASPKLREAVLSVDTAVMQPFSPPPIADTSVLSKENFSSYDISVRIDMLKETTDAFAVKYSYNTYDIVEGVWQETRKTRHMDVSKALLGKRKLTDYLSEQIGQVVQRELAYLDEVQRMASGENTKKQRISKYAGLVGKELTIGDDMISETEEADDKKSSSNVGDSMENSASVPAAPVISDEKLREIIVQAVADFLAIDTTMPEAVETAEPVLETTTPKPSSESEEIELSIEEQLEESVVETEQ